VEVAADRLMAAVAAAHPTEAARVVEVADRLMEVVRAAAVDRLTEEEATAVVKVADQGAAAMKVMATVMAHPITVMPGATATETDPSNKEGD
jgi:hypothetical protein